MRLLQFCSINVNNIAFKIFTSILFAVILNAKLEHFWQADVKSVPNRIPGNNTAYVIER